MGTNVTLDQHSRKKACFVIMPFRPDFDPVLAAIRDAVQRIGLGCTRLDDLKHGEQISADMAAGIAESALCIADLTGSNPNVMWEAGYAMAHKRPMVLLSQSTRDLPFDLKGYHVNEYDLSQGCTAVSLKIEAAIRETLALSKARKVRARWMASALVGVILAALMVLIIYWPPKRILRCDLIHIAQGGRVNLKDDLSIELTHVETLQGDEKKGSGVPSGHEFNKRLSDRDHIFTKIFPGGTPDGIARMDQAHWDDFRKHLKDGNEERAVDLPFAQFRVYRGGVPQPREREEGS
jgi:hypothetical protein